jgi:hypothetical protein
MPTHIRLGQLYGHTSKMVSDLYKFQLQFLKEQNNREGRLNPRRFQNFVGKMVLHQWRRLDECRLAGQSHLEIHNTWSTPGNASEETEHQTRLPHHRSLVD